MFCTQCGQKSKINSIFCHNCGCNLQIDDMCDEQPAPDTQKPINVVNKDFGDTLKIEQNTTDNTKIENDTVEGMWANVKLSLVRTLDFNGRSSRAEYWWFTFFVQAPGALLGLLAFMFTDTSNAYYRYSVHSYYPNSISYFCGIVLFLPWLAVAVRRLHDISKSGWALLWTLTIVGLFPVTIWLLTKGDSKDNKYGKALKSITDPLPVSDQLSELAKQPSEPIVYAEPPSFRLILRRSLVLIGCLVVIFALCFWRYKTVQSHVDYVPTATSAAQPIYQPDSSEISLEETTTYVPEEPQIDDASSTPYPEVIDPSFKIGGVGLKFNKAQIYDVLGEPSKEYVQDGLLILEYPNIVITLDSKANEIVYLDCTSPELNTDSGIHVGSYIADLITIYGKPYSANEELWAYDVKDRNASTDSLLADYTVLFHLTNGQVSKISFYPGEE